MSITRYHLIVNYYIFIYIELLFHFKGCADKLPTDYDKNRCGWTCADWSGKSFKGYSLAKNYCEDDWSQYQHCGTHIKGLIKDYCKISCDSCSKY